MKFSRIAFAVQDRAHVIAAPGEAEIAGCSSR
jgi:hypothetical protein